MAVPFSQRPVAAFLSACLATPLASWADETVNLPAVVVRDTLPVIAPATVTEDAKLPGDVAKLLEQTPGAAVVRNGAQTGIVQLRGLFNERVRVRVDGMEISPACPNHMDPPLHYAGLEALESLDVLVGATPVSQGGDSLAGSVEAKSRPPVFASKPGWEVHGKAGAGYDGSNDGKSFSLEAGAVSEVLSLRYLGGYQKAGNFDSARGTVIDTGYRNERHSFVAAYQHGSGVWEFEAGTHRARDVGTPTLPMDMVKDDANRYRLAFRGDTPLGKLEAQVYRHEIDHLMDNFSQRAVTGMKMQAPSTSDDTGLTLALSRAAGVGIFKFGAEAHSNGFNVYQQNLSMMTKPTQDMFRDAQRDRYGVYGEWEGGIAPGLRLNAGLRGDFVRMNTDNIVNVFAAAATDKTAFNAQDHKRTDSNLDATLALSYALQHGVDLEGALTRKTRSPSILERYLYTPTGASAGQADGRTYWGNLDLDPEVAHGVSLGLNARGQGVRGRASLFWQDISDFIQGQPVLTRLDSDRKPVLRYSNVNARLWGLETELGYVLGAWEMTGWASLARGENTDNRDNLYRLAPLRGGLSATYRAQGWDAGATWFLSARKDKVAAYNGELPTPGYGIVNLYGRISPVKSFNLSAGIDNLFDRNYYDPLAGVNRVAGGVVPVGGIMPGAGRYGYIKLEWLF